MEPSKVLGKPPFIFGPPLITTTKEGYIAIQISSQTTKKKVSENP
jgi:hypothetical protein